MINMIQLDTKANSIKSVKLLNEQTLALLVTYKEPENETKLYFIGSEMLNPVNKKMKQLLETPQNDLSNFQETKNDEIIPQLNNQNQRKKKGWGDAVEI